MTSLRRQPESRPAAPGPEPEPAMAAAAAATPVAGVAAATEAVRAFSRFYTRHIGALHEGLHGSAFALPEARVLYEIGSRGSTTAGTLARDLGLDPGYLSRLVRALDERGLIERRPNARDARQIDLALSATGLPAYEANVAAARRDIGAMLASLTERQRAGLVAAMARVEGLLAGTSDAVVLRRHRPGDIGWVLERHGAFYAEAYGFDSGFEALVAEILARFLRDYDPENEACWIAERDGERVGSVFVVRADAATAKLRLLLVEPEARGLGVGKRLVETVIDFARARGYRRLVLWTNDVLTTAGALYRKLGFRLVEEVPHADFGTPMVGQTYELEL